MHCLRQRSRLDYQFPFLHLPHSITTYTFSSNNDHHRPSNILDIAIIKYISGYATFGDIVVTTLFPLGTLNSIPSSLQHATSQPTQRLQHPGVSPKIKIIQTTAASFLFEHHLRSRHQQASFVARHFSSGYVPRTRVRLIPFPTTTHTGHSGLS